MQNVANTCCQPALNTCVPQLQSHCTSVGIQFELHCTALSCTALRRLRCCCAALLSHDDAAVSKKFQAICKFREFKIYTKAKSKSNNNKNNN